MDRVAILAAALIALAGPASAGASLSATLTLPTGESHTIDAYANETGDAGVLVDGQPVGAPEAPAPLPAAPALPPAPEVPTAPAPEAPTTPELPEDPTTLAPQLPDTPVVPVTPPAPEPAVNELVETVLLLAENVEGMLP